VPKRLRIPLLASAASALALLAAVGAAWAATQSFTDAEGDGSGGPECDIVSASVGKSHGQLVFAITVVEPIASKLVAPWVQIYKKPGELKHGKPPAAELAGNAIPRPKLALSNERRTATYRIKPAKLRGELGAPKKSKRFFWVARECFIHPDYAPDKGPEKPRVAAHAF
jgi:hypothetical protein